MTKSFRKINVLFLIAVMFLFILSAIYVFGELPMIELWHISLAFVAISFGSWFEFHSRYGEKAIEKKNERLKKVHRKIEEICNIIQTNDKEEKMEYELRILTELYDESNEPTELFKQTWNTYYYAVLCFLTAIFSRLGVDYLLISQLTSIEGITFFIGAILLVIASLNTKNLMTLFNSGKDPRISMTRTLFLAIVQALHTYIIWLLLPNFLSASLTFYTLIFFVLLWFTFIGTIILLWKGEEIKTKIAIIGLILIYLPWIYLMIISIFAYLELLELS